LKNILLEIDGKDITSPSIRRVLVV